MAFSMSLLVFVAVGSVCILPVLGTTCPSVVDEGEIILGFDCPRLFDFSDQVYCCDAGELSQWCCDYYDYGLGYLSITDIIVIGCGVCIVVALLLLSFGWIVVRCCGKASPRRRPARANNRTTTVVHRSTERPAPIMTVNVPPGYYTASAQPAPPQPPPSHKAHKAPKPGQYQQFQNEPDN